jgi:DNA polymerase-3 subunit gamma/tau
VSYLVLARKYRPQGFADLVGQEHVARTLTNAITLGRVHHAFLFTGARGVGKTSAARILARALCCAEGPTATPCGRCDFCREITSGQSVDVVEIDGASNRGVDDARTLREAVRYAPAHGRKKVTIIDEVHMFTTEAFNALLKTLEEPPPHAVFILATTEVHKIPITILSRCQRYDFKLIPTKRLVDHLSSILEHEKIACEPEGLRLLARQAGGSARDALSLLDQMIAYVGDAPITRENVSEVLGVADRRLLTGLFQAVVAHDAAAALRLLGSAIDRGIDLVQLSRAFLGFIHDVELAGLPGTGVDLIDVTADELTELKALAEQMPKGLAASLFDRWMRAVEEAGKSQTPRLLLEMGLVDLCFTEPLQPLGDLLARLEEMEQRLSRGGGPPRPGGGAGPEAPGGSRPQVPRAGPARAGGSSGPGPSASGATDMAPSFAPPAPVSAASAGPRPIALAATPAFLPASVAVPATEPASYPASSPISPNSPEPAHAASVASPQTGGTPAPRPIPGPRPAAAPTAFNAEEAWSRLLLRVQSRPALAAALDHAALEAWEPGRVALSFADRLPMEQTEKNRKLMEDALLDLSGVPTTLQLKMGAGAKPLLAAESVKQAESQASDRQRREEEARRHPMIRKAEEVFGISAREIKVS